MTLATTQHSSGPITSRTVYCIRHRSVCRWPLAIDGLKRGTVTADISRRATVDPVQSVDSRVAGTVVRRATVDPVDGSRYQQDSHSSPGTVSMRATVHSPGTYSQRQQQQARYIQQESHSSPGILSASSSRPGSSRLVCCLFSTNLGTHMSDVASNTQYDSASARSNIRPATDKQ